MFSKPSKNTKCFFRGKQLSPCPKPYKLHFSLKQTIVFKPKTIKTHVFLQENNDFHVQHHRNSIFLQGKQCPPSPQPQKVNFSYKKSMCFKPTTTQTQIFLKDINVFQAHNHKNSIFPSGNQCFPSPQPQKLNFSLRKSMFPKTTTTKTISVRKSMFSKLTTTKTHRFLKEINVSKPTTSKAQLFLKEINVSKPTTTTTQLFLRIQCFPSPQPQKFNLS